MPAISTALASEKLAQRVEQARPSELVEIHSELFPEKPTPSRLAASDLADHIRRGLAEEELVDLWNVVFPQDHDVWYDETEKTIRFNEELAGYLD